MKKILTVLVVVLMFTSCRAQLSHINDIVTTDIANFWTAYDQITSTQDSVLQYKYLDSLYLQKGTAGLHAIRQARSYTPEDYINAINSYPQFWNSVRGNTLRANTYSKELGKGIEKLKEWYPDLKPAKVYFTIGALRTNGTIVDNLVLIGSELAMSDKSTVATEFPEEYREDRKAFFASNPLESLVSLNVHEHVHTQQKPMVDNLLSYVIYEGVAEFVSTKALGISSAVPAIEYGKKNAEKVREKFEQEMFYPNNRPKWLWSNAPNEFGVRDLGYYIGYQMCENFYEQAENKKAAIKQLVELDYSNEGEIEQFVRTTGFFSAPLAVLYEAFEEKRPFVVGVSPLGDDSNSVSPTIKELTIEFSAPLNGHNTGVDYGDLGEAAFPKILARTWAEDGKSWSIAVELEPNKEYQLLISNNFRTENSIPLKPYLISFRTGNE